MLSKRTRDRPSRSQKAQDENSTDSTEFWLANSRVKIEHGPVGEIARIDRFGETYQLDYAGPISTETVYALKEVAWYVE